MPHKTAKEPAWTFDQHLIPRETHTQVAADGLRYASKTPGSPFATLNGFASSTMSCFLCGLHRPRAHMKSRKLAGRTHLVCEPGCKPKKSA
jgi:hypothetical protein